MEQIYFWENESLSVRKFSNFCEKRTFHDSVWKTSPSIPIQMEMFLNQFQFLNSLKTLFNITILIVLNSS